VAGPLRAVSLRAREATNDGQADRWRPFKVDRSDSATLDRQQERLLGDGRRIGAIIELDPRRLDL
jgi:hypothetical protein